MIIKSDGTISGREAVEALRDLGRSGLIDPAYAKIATWAADVINYIDANPDSLEADELLVDLDNIDVQVA